VIRQVRVLLIIRSIASTPRADCVRIMAATGGTISTYALAGIVGLVVYYVLTSITSYYRLREFKGPFFASFSYLWLARTDNSGESWRIHQEVRKKYDSSLIRIGPDLLITDDADIIRRMSAARSSYRRGEWYNACRIDVHNPSMFGTRDTVWHDDIKARASFGYSGKELPNLEHDIDQQIFNLKKYIRSKYLSTTQRTTPLDFAHASQFFALDVISKVAFGEEFGFLAADKDVNGYIKAMEIFAPFVTLCSDIPSMRKIFLSDWMMAFVGPKHTDKEGPGRIMG
jgi:hypothetical protein